MSKTIMISADHGLAVIYFLQSDVVSALIDQGNEVILLTDDNLIDKVNSRFGRPGLIVDGLRLDQASTYEKEVHPSIQWWLHFFRRAGASNRINLEAVNGYIDQVEFDAHKKRKMLFPVMKIFVSLMRNSRIMRNMLVKAQSYFTPEIYSDLFEKYKPDLIVSATP